MNALDVLEAIFTRKSIRKFTGEAISEEDLKTLLKAGFCAPSAHNRKPFHFIVIREQSILKTIAEDHPYAKMLPDAGCGIIVCGDEEKEELVEFLVEDCSAAVENMLLAAHGMGLGAVWSGLYPVPELIGLVKKTLNLPETIIPVGMVVVGVKDQERKAGDRYDETRVHFDKW
jgi:nitroreductase